ncbi:AAA family ATPase, partial [Faecalicatena contorta]|nr:AAA family ATPase [Faecalicatena contorta]
MEIKKVRHLENISIPFDKDKRKHLILTGKNGSGKTSVLEAVVKYIQSFLGE